MADFQVQESKSPVFKVEQGCPAARQGVGCGCIGICHELIDVVKAEDYFRLIGRLEAAGRDRYREALYRIAMMPPNAAALDAAKVAREALDG